MGRCLSCGHYGKSPIITSIVCKPACGIKKYNQHTSQEKVTKMAQCLTQKQALGNCLFVVERQGVVNKAWLKSTSYIIDTPGNTFLGLKDLISQAKSEGKIAVYYQKEDKAYCYLANYGS